MPGSWLSPSRSGAVPLSCRLAQRRVAAVASRTVSEIKSWCLYFGRIASAFEPGLAIRQREAWWPATIEFCEASGDAGNPQRGTGASNPPPNARRFTSRSDEGSRSARTQIEVLVRKYPGSFVAVLGTEHYITRSFYCQVRCMTRVFKEHL